MRWQTTPWTAALDGALPIRLLCVALLAGALISSLLPLGIATSALLALLAAALTCLSAARVVSTRASFVAVLIAVCALGSLRAIVVPDVAAPFEPYVDTNVHIVGAVSQDPRHGEKHTQVVVAVESIQGERVTGSVLLFLERGVSFSYRDRVEILGTLRRPEPFETDTGATFDYAGYLAAKGIGAVLFRPSVTREESAGCCSVLGALYAFKHDLEDSIESVFPEPHGGLLRGMLLGQQDALSEEVLDSFRRSSLVHIVVLSGYNLTIVAAAIMWLLARVPHLSRGSRLFAAGLCVVLFSAMVGFTATVLRAAIMALIAVGAQWLRRPGAALHALIIAATVMVLLNPRILTNDPSFVLSFLATFGLITLSPLCASRVQFVSAHLGLREIATATLATQLFILPALVFYTGEVSLVALPANLLVLPLVPAAMLFGAFSAFIGLLSSVLAFVPMLLSSALLWAVLAIAHIASSLPAASIEVASLQTPLIFLTYVVLVPMALVSQYRYTKEDRADTRTPSTAQLKTADSGFR